MRIALPSEPAQDAGYHAPFDLLDACHERVQRSLALLQRLVRHLQTHGADAATADAARDVLRYFDIAAPAHHADEERHVFPRLRAAGNPALSALADRLHDDHRRIEEAWATLRVALSAVANDAPLELSRLQHDADAFVALHDTHVADEDRVAFPAARSAAEAEGAATLQAMGAEMAARRGVAWPAPAGAPKRQA